MNPTFNFRRFGALLSESLREIRVPLLGILVVIFFGQLLFGFAIAPAVQSFPLTQNFRFFFGALFGLIALDSILIKRYQSTTYGTENLMLPASVHEKWLSMFLVANIFFWIGFLIVNAASDQILLNRALGIVADKKVVFRKEDIEALVPFDFFSTTGWSMFIFIATLSMAILVAGTWLNKNTIPLTLVAVIFIGIALSILNWMMANALFNYPIAEWGAKPFGSVALKIPSTGDTSFRIIPVGLKPERSGNVILYAVMPFIFLMLSAVYYFRLKEKEI